MSGLDIQLVVNPNFMIKDYGHGKTLSPWSWVERFLPLNDHLSVSHCGSTSSPMFTG